MKVRWSNAMERYSLEDAAFVAEAANTVSIDSRKVNDSVFSFPEKFVSSKRTKANKKKKAFVFRDESDSDADREEPMWMTKQQRQRQQEELSTPCDPETDPWFKRKRLEEATEEAAKKAAEAAEQAKAEHQRQNDDCIDSDAYDSAADLTELGKTARGDELEDEEEIVEQIDTRIVVETTMPNHDDSYFAMQVVDQLPPEEEEAMKRIFMPELEPIEGSSSHFIAASNPLLSVAKSFLVPTARPQAPPMKRPATDHRKLVEITSPKPLKPALKALIWSIRPKMIKGNIQDKTALFESIDENVRPEVLANSVACLRSSKKNAENARAVVAHWSSFFSLGEKQRFLASAANFPLFLDMSVWMDILQYEEFDILMVATSRAPDGLVRRVLGRLRGDGVETLRQVASWIDYDVTQILPILRQSAFMTPALERFLLPRISNEMFVQGAKLIASMFGLQYPTVLSLQSFPLNMASILRSFKVGEVGSRDLARAVEEMTESKPQLWEVASMMAEEIRDGAAVLRQFREFGETTISNAPKCWSNPLPQGHRVELLYEEVRAGQSTTDANCAIEATDGHITIAFRLINRPTHGPGIAVLTWQLPDSHKKFWLDCLLNTAEKKALVQELLKKCKYVDDSCSFQTALYFTFGITMTSLASIPGLKGHNANVAQKLASAQRRASCQATKRRIIINRDDMDEAFLFHLAWELDIVSDYMSSF